MNQITESQKWMAFALVLAFGWLVYLLAPILTPFAVAAVFAYLGDPAVDGLERWGLSRTLAVVVVFVVLTLIIALLVLIVVPLLQDQIVSLIGQLPEMAQWLQTQAQALSERFGKTEPLFDTEQMLEVLKQHIGEAGGIAAQIVESVTKSGAAVLAGLLNLFLIPVVTFYLLRDWDVLISRINELIPRHIEPVVTRLAKDSNDVLGAFLRGQITVMLALGFIYSFGLWLAGIELSILIGMIAGLISFVPYLGTIVGLGAGLLAALFQYGDMIHLAWVALVFVIGQMLEGMVLTPLLVGDRIGLHPVAVIFAVLAGGQLFGFLGILVALPAASVIMVLLRYAHERYVSSKLYARDVAVSEDQIAQGDLLVAADDEDVSDQS